MIRLSLFDGFSFLQCIQDVFHHVVGHWYPFTSPHVRRPIPSFIELSSHWDFELSRLFFSSQQLNPTRISRGTQFCIIFSDLRLPNESVFSARTRCCPFDIHVLYTVTRKNAA
jgi:hypothetical protein